MRRCRVPGFRVRLLLPAAAVLAAALAAPRADAQSFTSLLDALAQDVADRDAALQGELTPEQAKQKKALGKALGALGKASTSVARDLAIAAKVSRILDKAFPGDGVFGPDLDTTLDGFRDPLFAGRDRLAEYVGTLADGSRERSRGLAGLDAVDVLVSDADLSPTRTARAASLRAARRKLDSTWLAALGRPWRSLVFGSFTPRVGDSDVSADIDARTYNSQAALCLYTPSTETLGLHALEVIDPGAGQAQEMVFIIGGVTGPGTYPLASLGAGVKEYASTNDPRFYHTGSEPAYMGTVTLTTFDVKRRLAAGTFSFSAYSAEAPPDDDTRVVTAGEFRVGFTIFDPLR